MKLPTRRPRLRKNAQQALIDKVGVQNAVARLHVGADRIGRVPGVAADREGVAGVRRERHLDGLRHAAVRQLLMEDRADVVRGVVGRQIELNRDALPLGVGVRRDFVLRHVARQDRDREHADVAILRPEAALQRQARAAARKRPALRWRRARGRPGPTARASAPAACGCIPETGRSSRAWRCRRPGC